MSFQCIRDPFFVGKAEQQATQEIPSPPAKILLRHGKAWDGFLLTMRLKGIGMDPVYGTPIGK